MFPALAAAILAVTVVLPAPAENDSFSPQVGVAVDPTLNISPAFSLDRVCLPGSTCPG